MDNVNQIPSQDLSDVSEKRKFWEREILAHKESGKAMGEFCRERQLSLSVFSYYKYKQWECKRKNYVNKRISKKETASKFIPLQIISNHAPISEPTKNSDITIVFKNGHSVVMPASDLDAAFFIIRKVAGLSC
jgi:hypothetical protein